MTKKIAVLTEVYNEAGCLEEVLNQFVLPEGAELFIVDDGSTDGSYEIASKFTPHVYRHCINIGQGAAIITGLRAIIEENRFDVVVHLDSDGQHDPSQIKEFADEIINTDYDEIQGSRVLGTVESMTPMRKFFLPYFNWVIKVTTGYPFTDYLCGYRSFRVSSLKENFSEIFNDHFHPQYIATEMMLGFHRVNFRLKEIPTNITDRKHDKSRKGELRYGLSIIKSFLRSLLKHEAGIKK